jgi:hypothetical protein
MMPRSATAGDELGLLVLTGAGEILHQCGLLERHSWSIIQNGFS